MTINLDSPEVLRHYTLKFFNQLYDHAFEGDHLNDVDTIASHLQGKGVTWVLLHKLRGKMAILFTCMKACYFSFNILDLTSYAPYF